MHELANAFLTHLSTVADQAPSTDQSNGVTVALLGLAGVVITTLGAGYVTLRTRGVPAAHPLNSDDDTHDDPIAERLRVYEQFFWRNRIDPTLIESGKEHISDVLLP